jgi:hypothetical protein
MKELGLLPTDESIPLTASNVPTWRSWVKTVFMPLNRHIIEVIVSSSDLILEVGFPKCLEDMLAQIACWEPAIEGGGNRSRPRHSNQVITSLSLISRREPKRTSPNGTGH